MRVVKVRVWQERPSGVSNECFFGGYFEGFLGWDFVGIAGFGKASTLGSNTVLEWKPFQNTSFMRLIAEEMGGY